MAAVVLVVVDELVLVDELDAGGGVAPPPVAPALGVVDAGGLVVCELEVEVELVTAAVVDELAVVADEFDAVVPFAPVAPGGDVDPKLSSLLVVVGVRSGAVVGATSATWLPPHAASAMPASPAPNSASERDRPDITPAAEACDARTSGSR